jgi:drug/metabolite transporter (DMT)-like permease
MTKDLTGSESSATVTAWLLILLTPINAVFLAADPTGRGAWLPDGGALALLAGLAVLTAAAQWLLTVAYAKAEAGFLQPFDYVRLPINVAAGLVVFGYAPDGLLWFGAALIVAASAYLLNAERTGRA